MSGLSMLEIIRKVGAWVKTAIAEAVPENAEERIANLETTFNTGKNTTVSEFEWTDGYYANMYSGITSSHSSYSVTEIINISGVVTLEFPMYFSGSATARFCNADGSYLGHLTNSGSVGDVATFDNSETNYPYVMISCRTDSKSKFYLKLKTADGLAASVSKTAATAAENSERITALEGAVLYDETNPLGKIIEGGGGYCTIFRTIGVVGDSLSSGYMTYNNNSGVNMYDYSWIQYIARECGSTAYNFSQGGLSTRTFLSDTGGKLTLMRETPCQAYFIALGHNDYNQGVEIGTSADIDLEDYNNNADTVYGNYATIISIIKEVSPKAKIFVICTKKKTLNTWGLNAPVKYMAEIFDNVYVLDFWTYAQENIPSWHDTEGHGNTMGYLWYAREIMTYVDWIIRNNHDDFKYVQFINTEYEEYMLS